MAVLTTNNIPSCEPTTGEWSPPVEPLPMDPTAHGDCVATLVRDWYEKNRESWWDRHHPQLFSYRDNSGVVADGFILSLIGAVYAADAEVIRKWRRGC